MGYEICFQSSVLDNDRVNASSSGVIEYKSGRTGCKNVKVLLCLQFDISRSIIKCRIVCSTILRLRNVDTRDLIRDEHSFFSA